MRSLSISHHITLTCKKLGIPYSSCNIKYLEVHEDAKRLGELYLELKEIAAELTEISERHNIDGLTDILRDDIAELEELEHDLIRMAKAVKNETKKIQ